MLYLWRVYCVLIGCKINNTLINSLFNKNYIALGKEENITGQ